MNSRPFATALLHWYHDNKRDLPWRHTSDPYAVWLSEVILQQTRVEQGTAYWQRFLQRWPTVEALAAASEDEVLREWQGLGYYSRARHLHEAARQIAAEEQFPNTYKALRGLSGVGEYTAAAIASIAFGEDVATIDGNAYRVLARHFGIETPIDTTEGRKLFASLAQSQLPHGAAGTYNQAMMDFGATLCTPRTPQCASCPLMETCTAFRSGTALELPVKSKKTAKQERRFTYVFIQSNGLTALRKRPAGDIWQGLWEPPTADVAAVALHSTVSELKNLPQMRTICSGLRHILTHRIITAEFLLYTPETPPLLPSDYVWTDDIERHALPRLMLRALEMI